VTAPNARTLDIVALGEPLVEFSAEGRGPLRENGAFRRGWGGDTSNTTIAAARLGASVGYMGRVGEDEFGRSILELWGREGVDTSRVISDPKAPTGIYFTAFAEDGSHEFVYYRRGSAASCLRPSDIDPGYIAGARILHTSGITQAISNTCREATGTAMRIAQNHGVAVSYDANIRPKLAPVDLLRETFEATLPCADVVFASSEDLEHLYGQVSTEEALRVILAAGPQIAILKAGAQGCVVATADAGTRQVPGFPVRRVVDATGAGDVFGAAFLVRWMEGASPFAAARYANAVAAVSTQGLGAVEPAPTRAQVERFMDDARHPAVPMGETVALNVIPETRTGSATHLPDQSA